MKGPVAREPAHEGCLFVVCLDAQSGGTELRIRRYPCHTIHSLASELGGESGSSGYSSQTGVGRGKANMSRRGA